MWEVLLAILLPTIAPGLALLRILDASAKDSANLLRGGALHECLGSGDDARDPAGARDRGYVRGAGFPSLQSGRLSIT